MPTSLSINYAYAWDDAGGKMTKGVDDKGPYYEVSYYFADWSQSDQVVNELLGITRRSGTSTVRTGPHQHPLSPNLVCMDARIEPAGSPVLSSSGLPNYSGGFFVHCTYRVPPYQQFAEQDPGNLNQIDPATPIVWCTQELDFDTEIIASEGDNKFTWETGDSLNGKRTSVPFSFKLAVTTMTLTFHQLPYIPMTTVRSLQNKVNSATFMNVAAGKLLFVGAKTTRDYSSDDKISQRVTLVFKERSKDWREFLRPDFLLFAKIKDSSGNYVFDSGDFTPLINL